MPILVGFRSNKVQAGKMQIFPLNKYLSLFVGSQPCLIAICNKADTKLLPKLFVNRILNPTLEEFKLQGVLKEGESFTVFEDGGCPAYLDPLEQENFQVHSISPASRQRINVMKMTTNARTVASCGLHMSTSIPEMEPM